MSFLSGLLFGGVCGVFYLGGGYLLAIGTERDDTGVDDRDSSERILSFPKRATPVDV
ncbi:MAG: hypothetical protein ACKVKT_10990 [Rhodospirillales bacterium]|jgi:hypothetical protein